MNDNEPMDIDCPNHEEEYLNDVVDEEIIDNWTEGVVVSDVNLVYDQEMIISLINKCRGLIYTIKHSTIISLYFDNERKKMNIYRNLCYDIKSRWNSTYLMIDAFIGLREVIEKLFNNKHHLRIKPKQLKKLSGFELASDDWIMLSTLRSVLKPFFKATIVLSDRNYPSLGVGYYVLTRLKNCLQHHDQKETLMLKRLKQLLLAQFIYYFENDDQQIQLLKVND